MPIYELYFNKETEDLEIHEENCETKNELIEKGRLKHEGVLGTGDTKTQVYKKYKNAYPCKTIHLPDCCK